MRMRGNFSQLVANDFALSFCLTGGLRNCPNYFQLIVPSRLTVSWGLAGKWLVLHLAPTQPGGVSQPGQTLLTETTGVSLVRPDVLVIS